MNHLELPEAIQDEVIRFIKKTQHSQDQQEELNMFSKLIPNSFRQRITQSNFNKIFFRNGEAEEENVGKSNFLKEQIKKRDKLIEGDPKKDKTNNSRSINEGSG